MTNRPTPSLEPIIGLAVNASNGDALQTICQQFLEKGGKLLELDNAIVPQGWRYQIGSGPKVSLQHRDALFAAFTEALRKVRDWRRYVHKEGYHEQISVEIKSCEAAHDELAKYLLPDESLGDFYSMIDDIFRGSGHSFSGCAIVENDEDNEEFEDFD